MTNVGFERPAHLHQRIGSSERQATIDPGARAVASISVWRFTLASWVSAGREARCGLGHMGSANGLDGQLDMQTGRRKATEAFAYVRESGSPREFQSIAPGWCLSGGNLAGFAIHRGMNVRLRGQTIPPQRSCAEESRHAVRVSN